MKRKFFSLSAGKQGRALGHGDCRKGTRDAGNALGDRGQPCRSTLSRVNPAYQDGRLAGGNGLRGILGGVLAHLHASLLEFLANHFSPLAAIGYCNRPAQGNAGCQERLGVSLLEGRADAHCLASALHFRPELGV